jgi:hypothetical protein
MNTAMDPKIRDLIDNFDQEYKLWKAGQPNRISEYFKANGVNKFRQVNVIDNAVVIGNKVGDHLQGKAIIRYQNGSCYIGDIRNSMRHGFGHRSYGTDRTIYYYGEYENDMKSGRGRLWNQRKNKATFEGLWARDKKNGQGTLERDEGIYTGNFVEDHLEGKGKMVWTNGDEYEGQFSKDYRNGSGIMKYRNGDVYRGEFKMGKAHGRGHYTWKSGEVYEGGFTDGQMDGHGRINYSGLNVCATGQFQPTSDRNLAYRLVGFEG